MKRCLIAALCAACSAAAAAELYPSYQDYATTQDLPAGRRYLEVAPALRVEFLAAMRRYEQTIVEYALAATHPEEKVTLKNTSYGAVTDEVTANQMLEIMNVQFLQANPFKVIVHASKDRELAEAFDVQAEVFRGLVRDFLRERKQATPELDLPGIYKTPKPDVDNQWRKQARGNRPLNMADIQQACNQCHQAYTIH